MGELYAKGYRWKLEDPDLASDIRSPLYFDRFEVVALILKTMNGDALLVSAVKLEE